MVVPNLVGLDERLGDDVGLKLGDELGSKSDGCSLGDKLIEGLGDPFRVGDALLIVLVELGCDV